MAGVLIMASIARDFVARTEGVAAVEFALVASFLMALMLGGMELTNAVTARRHLTSAAYSVAQIVSEAPKTVNYMDVQMANDSAMLVMPEAVASAHAAGTTWTNRLSVTISEVVMTAVTPCSGTCAYSGRVSWSWGAARRPCSTNMLASASNAASSDVFHLPPDAFSAGANIVVDVAYNYTPEFSGNLIGPIRMSQTMVLKPRNVPASAHVKYVSVAGDPGATRTCPEN
jgi:Flp pilus assembly protein TadG